jgi:hypothetical protein
MAGDPAGAGQGVPEGLPMLVVAAVQGYLKGGLSISGMERIPSASLTRKVQATSLVILVEGATGARDNEKGWQSTTDIDDCGDRHRAESSLVSVCADKGRKTTQDPRK